MYVNKYATEVKFGPQGGRILSKQDLKTIRKFKNRTLHTNIWDITVSDCLTVLMFDIHKKTYLGGDKIVFGSRCSIGYNRLIKYIPRWLYQQVWEEYFTLKKERKEKEEQIQKKCQAELDRYQHQHITSYCTEKRFPPINHKPISNYSPAEKIFMEYMDNIRTNIKIYPSYEATPFDTLGKYHRWFKGYSSPPISFSLGIKDEKTNNMLLIKQDKLMEDSLKRRRQTW